MGYNTRYKLEVVEGDIDNFDNLFKDNYASSYCLQDDGNSSQPGKWYDYNKDMIQFSKKHPDVLFKLTGEGEDNEGIWHTYYKNGKYQECRAKIIFDSFDENKLK